MQESERPSARRSLNARQVLLFTAIAFLTVVIAVSVGWLVSEQNTIFSDYLDTYLAIHRFRVLLSDSERAVERYLRDLSVAELQTYYELVPTLTELHRTLEETSSGEIEDYFQLRAMDFGLLAYVGAMNAALRSTTAGASEAYSHYVRGVQIRRYVDGYAEQLLQVRLNVGEEDVRLLARRARSTAIASGSAVVLLILVMVGFSVLFSRTVTRPIVSLARTAREISSGNLDAAIIRVETSDEIQTLADAFATMQHNVKQLIHDVQGKRELEVHTARLSQSLREAQLLGLQSQINPHFLFNTLNTIARTALFEGASETTNLIQSLARVFRYMLQEPHASVSLEDELQVVEEYVMLQRHRFHERLEFVLECTVDARSVNIPALTVQPLVENAIRHGIEPREEGGTVTVDCRLEGSFVVITVADTGVGIESVPAALNGPVDHIGLRNVKTRLGLLHGEDLSFDVTSPPGGGTVITIRFPGQ